MCGSSSGGNGTRMHRFRSSKRRSLSSEGVDETLDAGEHLALRRGAFRLDFGSRASTDDDCADSEEEDADEEGYMRWAWSVNVTDTYRGLTVTYDTKKGSESSPEEVAVAQPVVSDNVTKAAVSGQEASTDEEMCPKQSGSMPDSVRSGNRNESDAVGKAMVRTKTGRTSQDSAKVCSLCMEPYTGFGHSCSSCRKRGSATSGGHPNYCQACDCHFWGFGNLCNDCKDPQKQ